MQIFPKPFNNMWHKSVMQLWILIWIWCYSSHEIVGETQSNAQICRSEPAHGVHWYSTAYEDTISSDPLCLDDAKFLVTRNCTQSGWVPETAPMCNYKQNVRSVFDNFAKFPGYDLFVVGENAAVYKSRKKQWSKDCIKFGFTKDILEYSKYFAMHPDYFWIPVRRHKKYFPHVWSNLGEKFGLVTEEFFNHGNDDCLVVNFSSNHIKSIPCSERYSELCLYVYMSPLLQLSCPKGLYTTRFQRDESNPKCYEVSKRECQTYFRYNKPYDRILYKALMDEFESDGDCRIEIDPFRPNMPFDMSYWKANLQSVKYVNWSPHVNKRDSPLATYTYADIEGDWLLGTNYQCTVCEQNMVPRTPILDLLFNTEEKRLELFVSHPEFLWTEDPEKVQIACFTTATSALLANVKLLDLLSSYSYTHGDLLINISVFEVELEDSGPGEYWCEAVAHPDFQLISSNRQVVQDVRKGVVFAIRSVHQCKQRCMGTYSEDVLKTAAKEFNDFLENLHIDVDIEDVRVMDVLSSNYEQETLLFHVTFSTEDLPDELEELNFDQSNREFVLRMNLINYVAKKLTPHVNATVEWGSQYLIAGFNHTMFCVSEMPVDAEEKKLIWARMNEIKVIPNLCLNENFVLNSTQCVGEFPYGVVWNEDLPKFCDNDQKPPALTQKLFQLLSTRHITVQDVQTLGSMQTNEVDLNPADIFFLGSIIGRFAHNVTELISSPNDLLVFAEIFSRSQGITADQASISHTYMNATNLLLDNFERLLQRTSIELSNLLQTEEEKESGVLQFKVHNTISFIIDPSVKNVTGIAFYLPKDSDTFDSGEIKFLTAHQNQTHLLEDEDLEGAAFLPFDLLEEIRSNFTGPLRLILTIIENDVLFRSRNNNGSGFSPSGRVITASIPNYDRPLPALFPIIFRPRRDYDYEDEIQCGFWNFHPSNSAVISEWSETGCDFLARSSRDEDPAYMCGCQHFTNFAFLMTGSKEIESNINGTTTSTSVLVSLDIITQVGCSLSLIGVLLIWLTALLFRSWREREGTKVLLQLSFGIGLQVLMVLLINVDPSMGNTLSSCITIGIVLHYSVMAIFAWMLITAYLQYLRYVIVFGNLLPKRFFLKANIVGWVLPIVPCLIICIIDPGLYVPANAEADLNNVLCYPQGNALYFGVILPVGLIILMNLCVFVMVIYNITTGLQKCNNNRKGSSKIHRAQLRLTILLFFLLGLTWIFGLLTHLEYQTFVFTYLFTIFGTLQGFVLFVYFIILDPQTRKLWLSRMNCCYKKELTSSTYNS